MLHQGLPIPRNIERLSLLFKVTCFLGLSWQLIDISSEYFKYKVNIQTFVFIPDEVEDLSMGICLPIEIIIDYKKFNSEYQYQWTSKKFAEKGMLDNLSIQEIYNYTYHAESIVYDAWYDNEVSNSTWSKTNLSASMKIQKYFFARNLCYLFSVRYFKPLSVEQLSGDTVAYIQFGKEISETEKVLLFLSEKDKIPFRETIRGRYIFRGNSSKKLDQFESSHYIIKKQLLPPPHETECFNYSNLNITNSRECIERCVVGKCFEKWHAISMESLVPNEADDYRFVRISNNDKYRAELNEMRLSCQSRCPKSCNDVHTVTIKESSAHMAWDVLSNNTISIKWERQTPSVLSVKLSCRPIQSLTELILYIMSSISTWTGLSMMSFTPIVLLRSLSKTKWAARILPLKLCRHLEITGRNHTDRVSRLEDCVVSQSLAYDKLQRMVVYLLKDRGISVR